MTGKRGRPPNSKDDRLQQAQLARRVVDEELAAMRSAGLMPLEGKAKANAVRRLRISARTLERLLELAPAGPVEERFSWEEWKEIERADWEADQADRD